MSHLPAATRSNDDDARQDGESREKHDHRHDMNRAMPSTWSGN
jgi:hypothetical protein